MQQRKQNQEKYDKGFSGTVLIETDFLTVLG